VENFQVLVNGCSGICSNFNLTHNSMNYMWSFIGENINLKLRIQWSPIPIDIINVWGFFQLKFHIILDRLGHILDLPLCYWYVRLQILWIIK
jgi:hypothetical protein